MDVRAAAKLLTIKRPKEIIVRAMESNDEFLFSTKRDLNEPDDLLNDGLTAVRKSDGLVYTFNPMKSDSVFTDIPISEVTQWIS